MASNKRRSRFKINFTLGLSLVICFAVLVAMLLSTTILERGLEDKTGFAFESYCAKMDKDAPEITLNGEAVQFIRIGEKYNEQGAVAVDDCDAVEIAIDGAVNDTAIGVYDIVYTAVDLSGNKAEMRRIVYVAPDYHGTVYLTFDDGPGPYTAELLDVLAKYGVKATFFVTGAGNDELIAREYNEGHAVGLHTFSHDYSYVYRGVDEFFEDLNRVQERVKNITGHTSYLMRFPGGSSNTVSARYDRRAHIMSQLVGEVEARGFTYFDWNVTSGDAGETTDTSEIISNVTDGLVEYGYSVVLQHDIKDYSVAAVEEIIKYGLANGYVFEKLSADSFTAHHGINN